MKSTEGMSLRLTTHAKRQMEAKGFSSEDVESVFNSPSRVYPNKKFEGQFRVAGKGICLIGKPEGNMFLVLTAYEDGVMTPPRRDQLDTPEGKAYAKLYEEAKRRSNGKKVRRENEYWPRVHQRHNDINNMVR